MEWLLEVAYACLEQNMPDEARHWLDKAASAEIDSGIMAYTSRRLRLEAVLLLQLNDAPDSVLNRFQAASTTAAQQHALLYQLAALISDIQYRQSVQIDSQGQLTVLSELIKKCPSESVAPEILQARLLLRPEHISSDDTLPAY